jgi:hypothetical protein
MCPAAVDLVVQAAVVVLELMVLLALAAVAAAGAFLL